MIVIDCNSGPFGTMKYGITVYLEVEGQRFSLESGYTKSGCKDLCDKWTKYAKTLNLSVTMSEDAKKFCGV